MKYKAIIFDMDGTIVDSEQIWRKAMRKMIDDHSIANRDQLELEILEKVKSIGLKKTCCEIGTRLNINKPIEEIIKEYSSIAFDLYETEVNLIEGFLDFHKAVTEKKLKYGIATNADNNTIKLANKQFGLNNLFKEHIYGIEDVGFNGKPDPAVYLLAAQKLEIEPKECIAIEDAGCGIEAAKKAGMFCIGINTAKDRCALSQADIIVDSYKEIDLNLFV